MLFLNKKQKFLSNDTFTLTTGINGELLTTSGILTNEANVGFEVPEGQSKYLTAGNDVVDLSKWNGTGSVNIGDIFSSDNDKVTVMAKNLAAGADLKLTSIENLEIVNSGEQNSVILKGANFKGLEAIKLIGDGTILSVSDFTQGVKIDATANADHITGSNKADTINGGAGNDIIIGNDGDDVLTGGNGADTFVVGTVKAAGVDQILDFSAEDKISMAITPTMPSFTPGELKKFDASTFSTVTYKTLDSVLATFGSGGANVTNPGDVVIFSYDGKTYALLANGPFTETGSALVDITGANVASLTESNFGGAIDPTPVPPAPTPIGTIYPDYAAFVEAAAFGRIPAGEQVGIKTLTGAEAGMLAVNKAYLDKIATGGIESVTGDIVVTVGATGEASDNFDATAFKNKLAADAVGSGIVMNINGSTAADVIITTFGGTINGSGGADTITAYAAATINGGDAADTIYVKAGGSINGSGGDDIIDASNATGDVTITGGSGDDTISLGAGADTVVFDATSNGEDIITNFTAGASNGDVLAISGLLGASFNSSNFFAASGAGDLTGKQVLIHAGSTKIDATTTTNSFDSSGATKYKMGSDQKLFIVDTVSDDNILYLATESSGTVTVTKVGTLNAGDNIASTLTADNFGNVA